MDDIALVMLQSNFDEFLYKVETMHKNDPEFPLPYIISDGEKKFKSVSQWFRELNMKYFTEPHKNRATRRKKKKFNDIKME